MKKNKKLHFKSPQVVAPRPASQRVVNAATITKTTTRSGPLPTPEDLEKYNRAVPGCGEKIIALRVRIARQSELKNLTQLNNLN